jgi:hypothetical protein
MAENQSERAGKVEASVVARLAAIALELDGPPALRNPEEMVFVPFRFDDHRRRLIHEIGPNGRQLSAKVFPEESGAILC